MNRSLFSKIALATGIAGGAFALASCGSGVSGTYTNPTGMVTLDLRSGGKASLTVMGEMEPCTYDVDGKSMNLTCKGEKTEWGIHDDGSLSGPGFVGVLKKSKS